MLLHTAGMISVAEAERLIIDSLAPLPGERCKLDAATGRFLREPVVADRESPPFDRATMDGIAIRFDDWRAGRRSFVVRGIQAAGQPVMEAPDPGCCCEIMTGAPVPEGLDCVIRSEDLSIDSGNALIRDGVELEEGLAVHPRGSDFSAGDVLVKVGGRLSGREIAVAASCGREALEVGSQPRVVVVTTGDELVDIDDAPLPHQIRRSNDRALAVVLVSAGFDQVERMHMPDEPEMMRWQLERFLGSADVLVLTGGVSKGRFDHLPKLLEELGVRCVFHGVSQKPGRPMWYGVHVRPGDFLHPDDERTVPIFALPGNPVSCFICLHRYVLPALRRMSGATTLPVDDVILDAELSFSPPLTWFLPVVRVGTGDGSVRAETRRFNTSGDFASLVGTDGFVELAMEQSVFPAGTPVPFRPWV